MVKEADALASAGYNVTVLYAYWNAWGTAFDKELIPFKKWKAICVGGDPQQNPGIYFLSRVIHKLALLITKATGFRYFADFAMARSSFFLARKALKYEADLYIGHNLGALPAIVKAAKTHKKPCGFDAEDFYRNDVSDDRTDANVQLKTNIEDKYIPGLTYLSSGSPGISAAYNKLYKNQTAVTLLNVFPVNGKIAPPSLTATTAMKLFWFSQTIGQGRGINDCIKAMQLLNNSDIELHLLGFVSENVRKELTGIAGDYAKLKFYSPVLPDEIAALASQFDIGLALEDKIPFNRDICLTNKIFTYVQAGLAIIATNTTAQEGLLRSYPGVGKVYENGNVQMLAATIKHYYDHRDQLYQTKKASFQIARTELNWEKESEKFIKVISDTLAV